MMSLDKLPLWEALTLVGLALLGLGSQILAADPKPTEGLVKRLDSDKFPERDAACKALEALGEQALPALHQAARSAEAEVKAHAVEREPGADVNLHLAFPQTPSAHVHRCPLPFSCTLVNNFDQVVKIVH